jgi:CheY-like chemotaxis protein
MQLFVLNLRGVPTADQRVHQQMEVPPTLLVSDIVIPGMNGFMLADRIKSICPKCRILFVSGNACVVAANEPNSKVEILAKPVPPTELMAKIRSMLASG